MDPRHRATCRPYAVGAQSVTDALAFDAIVYKVQTLVDNGIRVTLDLPESDIEAAAVLMGVKRGGLAIKVSVTVDKQCGL